jgi:hypothetical protein
VRLAGRMYVETVPGVFAPVPFDITDNDDPDAHAALSFQNFNVKHLDTEATNSALLEMISEKSVIANKFLDPDTQELSKRALKVIWEV